MVDYHDFMMVNVRNIVYQQVPTRNLRVITLFSGFLKYIPKRTDFWKVDILQLISRDLRCFSKLAGIEPRAPMIIGTTFVSQFHIRDNSSLRSP